MPLATHKSIWISNLNSQLQYPMGSPEYATAKISFVTTIVNGIVNFLDGKKVITTDSGTFTSGYVGIGTGIGLSAFNVAGYSSAFRSAHSLAFQTSMTTEATITMNAILTTLQTALTNISISTTHTKVSNGTGTVSLVPLQKQELVALLIISAVSPINSTEQSKWRQYADVIASGIIAGSSTLTGTVTITTTVPPTPPPIAVLSAPGEGEIS